MSLPMVRVYVGYQRKSIGSGLRRMPHKSWDGAASLPYGGLRNGGTGVFDCVSQAVG
jgi:hypothetical protein